MQEAEPHVIAVTKQGNGELTEDVLAQQLAESDTDETVDVVDTAPMPSHDRPHPADALPGTLPRE